MDTASLDEPRYQRPIDPSVHALRKRAKLGVMRLSHMTALERRYACAMLDALWSLQDSGSLNMDHLK